ncbi:MAG: hypothetical protein OEY33_07600 [Bdellovibrionales bacterium]|nr:hypothetical protein [Bdellovibrionales bacterium]
MKILIVIFSILFSQSSFSNFPETFGASPNTSGLAGQASGDIEDPSNSYYFPSMAAYTQNINLSASIISVTPSFEPINNILTLNDLNDETGSSSDEVGSANTNYDTVNMAIIHATLPIRRTTALSFSGFFPIGLMMETNSGHPFLPEYVMHRSRYKRTQIYLNFAQRFFYSWAFSLGVTMGMQTGGNMDTVMNFTNNDSSIGSFANSKIQVKPNIGGQISLMRNTSKSQLAFTLVQEIKHNIKLRTFVKTGDPLPLPNDLVIESMQYYDPWTFRIGYTRRFSHIDYIANIEAQYWENYKSPVVRLQVINGNLLPSSNYESIKTRLIAIPKLGLSVHATNDTNIMLGLAYRPTPFEGNFSGAGNSIDTDSVILGAGLNSNWNILGLKTELSLSAQYQQLIEKKVTKSAGIESGGSGSKLGSPGYTIGGNILSVGAGIKVSL